MIKDVKKGPCTNYGKLGLGEMSWLSYCSLKCNEQKMLYIHNSNNE